MKKILKFIPFLAIIVFSCETIEINQEAQLDSPILVNFELDEDVTEPVNINGVLRFDSDKSFSFWHQKVGEMTQSEIELWEENLKFNSLSTLFEGLVDEENYASDSLFEVFKQTSVMPNKIHSTLSIHSKAVIPYIDVLHFFEDGGFYPAASILEPKIENLLNREGKVIVGQNVIQYTRIGKFINKKLVKLLDEKNLATITSNSYIDRHTSTLGDYRTITDLSYYVNEQSMGLGGNEKSFSQSGFIEVRNFRKGLFGWNTRKTTSLRIQGTLNYGFNVCDPYINGVPSQPPFPYSYSYPNINITSNGSSTTSIGFAFTTPTNGYSLNNLGCLSNPSPVVYWLGFNLILTGEGGNVSNFVL